MAYLAGRRVRGLSAVAHGDVLGEVQYRGFVSFPAGALDDARTRRKLEGEIMIALAGLVAEMVHTPRVDRAGAPPDLQRAMQVAFEAIADPEEATAFVNWLFVRTRNRLSDRRCARAIAALSTQIAERRTLTGAQMRTILERSLRGTRRRA
jgi:hypothetical protein